MNDASTSMNDEIRRELDRQQQVKRERLFPTTDDDTTNTDNEDNDD